MKLSIALATYNEESNISRCLNSIKDLADEIVVVDGGSDDHTIMIAKSYKAKVIITNNPLIFHINKQKALEQCKGDWILQLDADEIITSKLGSEIMKTIHDKRSKDGYYIPRKNYFSNHWLKKGGQYPDYVIRLFRNNKAYFPCKSVHEQIVVVGKIGYLKEPLLHFTYNSANEYWKKASLYINIKVQELITRKSNPNIIFYGLIQPLRTFFKLYIRHKGFLDGRYGFIFALFSALHYPLVLFKYFKYQKIHNEQYHL